MVRIGLTGGPGSGKSTVAEVFKRRGIVFTDLDYLSRVAVEPGQPAFKKIVKHFGKSVVGKDGCLDRSALRLRLIKSKAAKVALEKIIHPEVFRLLDEEACRNRQKGEKFFGVEAPLLFEAGMEGYFDCIITVYASYDIQVERVSERDDVDKDQAKGLIDSQIPLDEKAQRSDFVIVNEGGMGELEGQVDKFLLKFQ